MSAEAPALVRSFRVGKRRCTVSIPRPVRGAVICPAVEWHPDAPPRLGTRELRQYEAGLDAAIRELVEQAGMNVMLVEV